MHSPQSFSSVPLYNAGHISHCDPIHMLRQWQWQKRTVVFTYSAWSVQSYDTLHGYIGSRVASGIVSVGARVTVLVREWVCCRDNVVERDTVNELLVEVGTKSSVLVLDADGEIRADSVGTPAGVGDSDTEIDEEFDCDGHALTDGVPDALADADDEPKRLINPQDTRLCRCIRNGIHRSTRRSCSCREGGCGE